MSNEGEWTTVTSKHSTSHKLQRPLTTTSSANATSTSSSKTDSRTSADKSAGTNKSGNHNHHHHHTKKPAKKDAAGTASTQKDSGTTTTTSTKYFTKQTNRSRSSSFSSDSDSSQSDDDPSSASGPSRPPYHAVIMIHCPFSTCDLTDPLTDSTSLVAHLKEAHQIAFKNIHHMFILLDRYLSHWAEEIEAKGIEKVAVKENESDEYYTIDPTVSTADRTLRDEIQREKLNEILKIQEKERNEDAKLKRKCLFCKNICENRTILFKHMFAEHNFNIGLPDNLVNVNEFLDMLEAKLTSLQCLYCEKTFTSPAVLRKHMRKKKHFKISARNRLYDQFYVINYLEPGKNWENFEHDRYDSDDDRRDDSWADWDDALEEEKTKCLFEEIYFNSAQSARDHMKEAHGFDLDGERHRLGLNFYQTISLINYIRRQTMLGVCFSCLVEKPETGDKKPIEQSEGHAEENEEEVEDWLVKHLKESGCGAKVPAMDMDFWKDAQFLLPMLENDPLLMIFGEEDSDDEQQGTELDRSSLSGSDSDADDI
ncbi:hypothetical protein BC939DRAFT_487501 [Gamsiella multidivaricata]|uniref:uncharacterized protein n=1 Tax=Gamsiella multidivaricata TaxID=101098 RepID=UPI00221F20A3|nr:uncharacterized protein BC939DRAFT_487501 [Gamsiella multidivaricata]KAG0357655.1 hypothetical protein BGZ54_000256 [Gamsiella multidivaricata]KAI7820155.1 hypothetical protein BC939DRAFT_487501 [Gamsiella multidivaricata]